VIRVLQSLPRPQIPPAMAAGISNHIWSGARTTGGSVIRWLPPLPRPPPGPTHKCRTTTSRADPTPCYHHAWESEIVS
jgi:hypothetical protein